jgi:hypothetical protein
MPSDGWKALLMATESIHRRGKGELDRLIVALAARQHGVVGLWQLVELGLSAAGVRTRVAAGRLHRIHQGVYAVGRPDVTIKGRWMAAVLACGEGAVLSHRSAATLRGLLNARSGWVDVTVPRRTPVVRAGIRVHRSTCLAPQDRAEVHGIPCTSVPATLLALAATAPRNVLDSACNQAEMEGLLDMDAIGELLTRRRSHLGASRLRTALEVDGLGLDRTKSGLERRFLQLARETGLPVPAVNNGCRSPARRCSATSSGIASGWWSRWTRGGPIGHGKPFVGTAGGIDCCGARGGPWSASPATTSKRMLARSCAMSGPSLK